MTVAAIQDCDDSRSTKTKWEWTRADGRRFRRLHRWNARSLGFARECKFVELTALFFPVVLERPALGEGLRAVEPVRKRTAVLYGRTIFSRFSPAQPGSLLGFRDRWSNFLHFDRGGELHTLGEAQPLFELRPSQGQREPMEGQYGAF